MGTLRTLRKPTPLWGHFVSPHPSPAKRTCIHTIFMGEGCGDACVSTKLHWNLHRVYARACHGFTPSLLERGVGTPRVSTADSRGPHAVLHRFQASHVSTGTTYNALVINPSGGNVGVGTTAPYKALHVTGSSAGDVAALVANTNAGLASSASLGFGLWGTSGSGTGTTGYAAQISAVCANAANGNTDVTFNTYTGSVVAPNYTLVERMRISAAGNVGIGTTAPIAPLHVTAPGNGLTSVQYAGGAAQWYTVVGNYPTTTGSVLTIPIVNQAGNWTTTMFRIRGFNGRYNNSGSPLHFTADCSTVTLGTGQGGVTVLSIGGNTASVTFNQSTVSLLINFTGAYGAGAVAVVIEYLATLPSTTVIPASISAN